IYKITTKRCNKMEAEKNNHNHQDEILFDDRSVRPGEKFADSELIGLPERIVISDKTLSSHQAEVTDRATGASKLVDLDRLFV
ncbi:MAG: His/Gly/Thr/Pro-type tRNA ligase C-terminal domain-containing protein, partial [Candidatus Saccharibacteria bacterium]|nr:His/Gly/Thr/Pro-type tRNA ligase C-terminal domain-containing protein [Candidatus Saccharibacteria bacterium]